MNIKKEMNVDTKEGNMRIAIVDLTPEAAAHILEFNTQNRKIKNNRILQYASDMKNGRWKSNGTPIILSNEWVLKDGQHRLLSVIKSGVTLYNTIVIFVPEVTANNYDLNATRSINDILTLDGINDVALRNSSVAAGITFSIRTSIRENWETARLDKLGITKSFILSEMNKHHDAVEFANEMINSVRGAKIRKSSIISAVINAYLSGYSEKKLRDFCTVLSSGITTQELDVQVIKLRDYANSFKSRDAKDYVELYYRTQNVLHNYEMGIPKKILTTSSKEYYKYPKPSNDEQLQLDFEEKRDKELVSDAQQKKTTLSDDELRNLFRSKNHTDIKALEK